MVQYGVEILLKNSCQKETRNLRDFCWFSTRPTAPACAKSSTNQTTPKQASFVLSLPPKTSNPAPCTCFPTEKKTMICNSALTPILLPLLATKLSVSKFCSRNPEINVRTHRNQGHNSELYWNWNHCPMLIICFGGYCHVFQPKW